MKFGFMTALSVALATALSSSAYAQTSGDKTPSTVDGKAENKGVKADPGTTGAMDNAVGGVATSAEDVKRQQEGKPTMAEQSKGVKPIEGTKPGITQNSPGTVGAAPGTTPPMNNEKR